MDYFQLIDNLEQLYPGKDAKVVLDDDCIQKIEIEKHRNKYHPTAIVQYNCAKVKIENESDRMIPIDSHRLNASLTDTLSKIPERPEMIVIEDER